MNSNWIKWSLMLLALALTGWSDCYASETQQEELANGAPEKPPVEEAEEVREEEGNGNGDGDGDGDGEVVVGQVRRVGVEAVFGQVAKTVVYGGASLARLNNRLLCHLLTHQTQLNNTAEPTLYVFAPGHDLHDHELAFRIYANDDVTPELTREARLEPNQMTYILVHGWMGGIHKEIWLSAAKDAVLSSSYNHSHQPTTYRPQVLVVDWSQLAGGSLYEATSNSERVASRLGQLLRQLHQLGGLQPELMHCLGHSIGAHICGRAAREAFPPTGSPMAPKFGRISALDPGGFCYERGVKNESTFAGMRPSDALVVDAYYSNRSPFGNKYQVAQYNVRLNNGLFQRSCSVFKDPQRGAQYFKAAMKFLLGRWGQHEQELLTCDHYYATRFAQHRLPPHCSHLAYACPSYSRFLRGQCGLCSSPAHCYPMDFEFQLPEPTTDHAYQHLANYTGHLRRPLAGDNPDGVEGGVPYALRRPYYLRTSPREPMCSLTYRVRVHLSAQVDLRHFRNDWLALQLIGSQEEVMQVWLAASGRAGDTLRLYGPWEAPPSPGADDPLADLYGLDNRTLTALFELLPDAQLHTAPDGSLLRPPLADLVLFYDNVEAGAAAARRSRDNQATEVAQEIPTRPVDWVQVDYMSSTDPKTRQRNSLRRQQDQIRLIYRRLETS